MGLYERIFGGGVRSITPGQARDLMSSDPQVVILDVRQPVETRSGTIANATLIPLTELGRRLGELPRDKTILVYCRSGHRSPIAAGQLLRAGLQVVNMSGGILGWQQAGLPIVTSENTRDQAS